MTAARKIVPACGRCRRRLQAATREAATVPLSRPFSVDALPDRAKFDPMIGAWLFVESCERDALIEHVLAFIHQSAAPRGRRPALRVIRGGRALLPPVSRRARAR